MTTSDFIALATGAVTLVGVVLVFGQLRSLNQQSRMQTFAEYTRRYQEIALNFPEDIHAGDFSLKGSRRLRQHNAHMRAYYDLCFEEWYLHRDRLIENEFWKVWLESMETASPNLLFSKRGGRCKQAAATALSSRGLSRNE